MADEPKIISFLELCKSTFLEAPAIAPPIYQSSVVEEPDLLLWDPGLRYCCDLMCPIHDKTLQRTGRWTDGSRKDEEPRHVYSLGNFHFCDQRKTFYRLAPLKYVVVLT
jgi:hypothetical protein